MMVGMPRDASHEVSGSFSTTHPSSPPDPGLPHPVRSVFRVSRPLDGFLLDWLPALFRAGALMEFQSLQSFPLARSSGTSRRRAALLTFERALGGTRRSTRTTGVQTL